MKQKRYTFSKQERLTGIKTIDDLFDSGKSFFVYPMLVLYKVNTQEDCPSRLLISVSKRKFKLAVDRNRIKRQIRESYRCEKANFIESLSGRRINFGLIYVGRKPLSSHKLNLRIKEALDLLSKELND